MWLDVVFHGGFVFFICVIIFLLNFFKKNMNKKFKNYIGFVFVLLIAVVLMSNFHSSQLIEEENLNYNGVVLSVMDESSLLQKVSVEFTSGPYVGESVLVENDSEHVVNAREFKKGDKVLLEHQEGKDAYYIADYVRTGVLFWLFVFFVVMVVVVTRWQGVMSILGMVFSFLILFELVLPRILLGADPVWMAVFAALFIVPITFYFSHGLNRKTSVAVIGTFLTLFIIAICSIIFIKLGHLTGLSSEEASFLKFETVQKIDFKGLLLAGMMIGLLGVLDDITVAQAAVVQQLRDTNEKLSIFELYKRAMNVGRDHIASMVNTLVLVYAGASLPLLLLFLDFSQPLVQVVNYEFLAEEIIKTLLGSIALIMAVPITTLLASFILVKRKT